MKPEDVLKYYGSRYNFRKMTGMSHSSLANWISWGYVPEASQYKLERLTRGELKTQWSEVNE
jgi:phage terminase large subunit